MKKLTKILVLILSLALLAGAVVIATSAADEVPAWTQEEVIAVYTSETAFKNDKADGKYTDALDTFNDFKNALDYAKNNGASYIALTGDWECGENVLAHPNHLVNSTVTLDLNGYTMSFSVNRKLQDGAYKEFTWNTMAIGADNITYTVVGNGGTIKVSAGLIQHNQNNSHVILDGGEGGLNIHTIKGHAYDVDNSEVAATADNAYPGNQMIKVGDGAKQGGTSIDTGKITLVGEINIEKHNTMQKVGIETVGNTTINLGTEDKALKLSYKDMVNTTHSTNLHALVEVGVYTKETQTPIYEKYAIGPTVNVINSNINIYSDKLFTMSSSVNTPSTDDDVIKLNIRDSYVFADDYDANNNGASNSTCGVIYVGHVNIPIHIDIDDSTIIADHGQYIAYGAYASTGKIHRSLMTVDNSRLESRTKTNTVYPAVRQMPNVIYTDTILHCGSAAGFGALWRPYSAEDTVITDWPWFVDQGITDGMGVLVKAGCYFTSDMTGRTTNCDYRNGHGIAHTHTNKTCTPTTAMVGTYTNTNYHSCSITEVDANGRTIPSYHPETNEKLYLVVDTTKPLDTVFSPTGIKTFNSATAGKEYKDGTSPALEGLSWIVGDSSAPRCGKYTVAASQKFNEADGSFSAESNKYITHSYWANTEGKTYSGDPYLYNYTHGLTEYFSATKPPVIGVTDAQFYTVDLDFMSIKDKCAGLYVTFNLRTLVGGAAANDMIKVSLGEDGTWYSTGKGNESYKMDFTPGKWMHLTFVLEMPTKVESEVEVLDLASAYDNAKLHLYIDGTLANTFDQPIPCYDAEKDECYLDSADSYELTAIQDVRLGFGSATSVDSAAKNYGTSIDNFAYAAHPISSDLEDAASHMTKAMEAMGIEQPKDIPFAVKKAGGQYEAVGVEYLAEEFIVYSILDSGPDSLTLNNSYYGTYDLDAAAQASDYDTFDEMVADLVGDEAFKIKINLNGHKIAFSEHSYVEEYDAEADTLTIRNVTDADKVTVTFDDGDDATENVTLKAIKNKTLAGAQFAAAPAVKELVSPYAKVYVGGGWATTYGGAALPELEVGEEDITLYPAVKKTVSTLDGLLFNIQANDNITFSYYLPAEWIDDMKEDTIENFVVTGTRYAYPGTNLGTIGLPTDVATIGEKEYYVRSLWPSVSHFNFATVYVIDYNVVIDGVTYAVSARYEMSALEYCRAVLDDATQTAKAKDVAANYLRYGYEYLNALAVLNANETYATRAAAIKAVYDEYKAAGVAFSEYEENLLDDKNNTDAGDLTKYTESMTLDVEATRIRLVLKFKADTKVQKVSISYAGWATDENGYAGIGTLYASSNSECTKDSDGNYTLFKTQNIKPYDTFGVFTITFTLEDGTVVTGSVSAEDYYNDLVKYNFSTEAECYKNLLSAIKEFGDSVVAYRFTER